MSIRDDIEFFAQNQNHVLFDHGSSFVLSFVETAFSGDVPAKDLVNYHMFWYSIGESADMLAFRTKRPDVDLTWAHIANRTYQLCASLPAKRYAWQTVTYRWMRFKARLINTLGSTLDPDLAKPDDILNWFFDNLEMSFEEAQSLQPLWVSGKLDSETFMKLAYIKERAMVVAKLPEGLAFQRSKELSEWIALFAAYDKHRKAMIRNRKRRR